MARLAPRLGPDAAAAKREVMRAAVQPDVDAGRFDAAGAALARDAALLGDPIAFVEAGALYLRAAASDRDVELSRDAIALTDIALDILGFYDGVASGTTASAWRVIDTAATAEVIAQAQAQRDDAEALIVEIEAEIEAEREAARAAAAQPSREEKGRPHAGAKTRANAGGAGLLIGGGLAVTAGLGGVSLVIAGVIIGNGKQQDVNSLMSPAEEDEIAALDAEGKRANGLAILGAGVSVVGLAIGVPLLILGVHKRKGSASLASLRVSPWALGGRAGVNLGGRF